MDTLAVDAVGWNSEEWKRSNWDPSVLVPSGKRSTGTGSLRRCAISPWLRRPRWPCWDRLRKMVPPATSSQAEVRPLAYFGFGDEGARHDRAVDGDVEIAEVIGDDQAMGGRRSDHRALHADAAENSATCALQPQRALDGGEWAAQPRERKPHHADRASAAINAAHLLARRIVRRVHSIVSAAPGTGCGPPKRAALDRV